MRQRKSTPDVVMNKCDESGGAFRMGRNKKDDSEEGKRKTIEMRISGPFGKLWRNGVVISHR